MNKKLTDKVKNLLRKKAMNRSRCIFTTVISIVLSFVVLYMNIFPAMTMTEREENLANEVGYSLEQEQSDAVDYEAVDENVIDVDFAEENEDATEQTDDPPTQEITNPEDESVAESEEVVEESTEATTETSTEQVTEYEQTSEEVTTTEAEQTTEESTDINTEYTSEIEVTTEVTTSQNESSGGGGGHNKSDKTTEISEVTVETTTEMSEMTIETTTSEKPVDFDKNDDTIINDKDAAASVYERVSITNASSIPNGDYIIVCDATYGNYAITNQGKSITGGYGLVQKEIGSAGYYISGDLDSYAWTFKKDSGNTYYISSSDGSYMYIGGSRNVYTKSSPQSITVKLYSGITNAISFYARNAYVNCFGGGQQGVFSGWSSADTNSAMHLYKKLDNSKSVLIYDINIPSYSGMGTGWMTTPSLQTTSQTVSDGTKLFSQPDGYYSDEGPAGIKNLYRVDINDGYGMTNSSNQNTYIADEFPYYKEMGFSGWITDDVNGEQIIIDPETEVTKDSDGNLVVQARQVTLDSEGCISSIGSGYSSYTIPNTSLLKGGWRKVSSPVTFFVNYKAAILDTEGDVSGRGTSEFTGVVAVARLFFGTTTVGGDGNYAKSTNETITSYFTSQDDFDYDSGKTSIVIKYTTAYENGVKKQNYKNPDKNQSELEASLLNWIRADDSINIYVCTANNKTALISNENATPDNYSVRWYVLKEQDDGWHIDGIMVAKTTELVVTKSFSGIDNSDIQSILNNFKIDVTLNGGDYFELTTSGGVSGQYEYNGYNSESKSVSWTLRVPMGEVLSLEEKNYTKTGFTVYTSSVVDGDVDNVEFKSDTHIGNIVSGTNNNIAFNNMYVSQGKGILALLKKDAITGKPLQHATFTLKSKDGSSTYSQTATSNQSGVVMFTGLEAGNTYVLSEAIAPDGYVIDTSTREVTVSNVSGNVVVNLEGNTYYTEGSTTVKLYEITNSSKTNVVKVKKTFSGATATQVSALGDNYKINYTLGSKSGTLLLKNASNVTVDGLTYEWYINNISDGTEISLSESGYNISGYDTVNVTATVNGNAVTPVFGEGTATVTTTKNTDACDIVLTNSYSNSFILKLLKKDKSSNVGLEGAVFKLYGPHSQSTNTADKINVTDGDSSSNYYYIRTLTTDSNGEATAKGLSPTDIYYIKEITAPNSYTLDETPIKIDASDEDSVIVNGIMEKTVYNNKSNGKISIKKVWRLNNESQLPDSITFMLFRKAGDDGVTEFIGKYKFDVTDSGDLECEINSDDGLGFPWYDANGDRYYYYIAEEPIDGFAVSFDNDDQVYKLRYNGEIYYCLLVEPGDDEKNVYNVYTNMPDAGGKIHQYDVTTGVVEISIIWLTYILMNFSKKRGKFEGNN